MLQFGSSALSVFLKERSPGKAHYLSGTEFKREADPTGLLNPGKMIGWENPDFDLDAGGVWLFAGLQPVIAA